MPRVSKFYGIVIYLWHREHGVPHFHAQYQGFVISIRIDDGAILEGRLPPSARRLVEAWRRRYKEPLIDNWNRMRRKEAPHRIPPLE